MVILRTCFGVALEAQHDLRCTIPARRHVFGHEAGILIRVYGEATSKTKIADLELAVGVHQEIAGLKISVEDVRRVYVFQPTKNLVDEGLEVGVCEWLARPYDGCEIALHEL